MENSNTTAPLWKQLIERQKPENGIIPYILAAQEFTALAVNNLAPLAEALEELLDRMGDPDLLPYAINKAKEALNKIS